MSAGPRIILASGSAIRREILTAAGVPFEVMRPDVDEGAIKAQALREGADLESLAMRLAEAKCMDIARKTGGPERFEGKVVLRQAQDEDRFSDSKRARKNPEHPRDLMERQDVLVIGSDQIMEFAGRAYDKPASMAEAKARLMETQGAPHTLINAIAAARDGEIIWRNLDRPVLFMRSLSETEIDAYLEAAGPEILHSVGAYMVERLGARLFERIEGDHFAVLGLSLFPLLELLRREGALDF